MQKPTFYDVLLAQRQIRPYLARTPLYQYPAIDELIGTTTVIKHENYQPVGAFKVRGGINLISQLPSTERGCGVISASTGNHGQSIAYAARLFDIAAHIVVPEGANPGKVAAIRGMGANVIFHGATFDDARLHCEALAQERGYRYIHSGNEPLLIAGVATEALEMFEEQPKLDVLFVPIGGGSGAAGTCLVAKTISPQTRVIGVQSEAAPAAHMSWRQRACRAAPNHTIAEGLATGAGFALPQSILWELLYDFVLVSDAALLQAMAWMLERAHTLVEAAGAAALAAAYQMRASLADRSVGLICSGGNTSMEQLRRAIAAI